VFTVGNVYVVAKTEREARKIARKKNPDYTIKNSGEDIYWKSVEETRYRIFMVKKPSKK